MDKKEDKKHNKGGRPKKGATEKLTYRVAVKLAAADYFRLMTRAYEAGVSSSEYMRECFRNGHVKGRLSEEHAAHVRNLCVSFTDDQSLITQPRNPSSPRRMRRIRSAFCPAHSPLRRL